MDEPKHTMGCEPNMVSLCPFCICAAISNIGGEHRPKIGHFLTTLALGKAFGIDGTLFCCGIEKLTPGIQVDDQHASVHRLLVATEATLATFVLP